PATAWSGGRACAALRGAGGVHPPEPRRSRLGGAGQAGGADRGLAAMAAVERPRIVSAGHAEAGWRASAWVAGLGQRTSAEVLDGHRRLVVVSPHPDDETLACGGLMRAATRAGLELLVLAVTDGEACYPDGQQWTADRLRRVRPQELEDALDTLGA